MKDFSDADIINEYKHDLISDILTREYSDIKDSNLTSRTDIANLYIYNGDRSWSGEYKNKSTSFKRYLLNTDILEYSISVIPVINLKEEQIELLFYNEQNLSFIEVLYINIIEWNSLIQNIDSGYGFYVNKINDTIFTEIEKIQAVPFQSGRGPHFGKFSKVYFKNGSSKNLYIPEIYRNDKLFGIVLAEELDKYHSDSSVIEDDFLQETYNNYGYIYIWDKNINFLEKKEIDSTMLPGSIYTVSIRKRYKSIYSIKNINQTEKDFEQKMQAYLKTKYKNSVGYNIEGDILEVVSENTVTYD